ncbi:S-adenosylmethionine synthetase [Variovorax sp. HW608]|uniref:methionine adenosyltransferase n=1 Tax=Variovorax sp. HW608 TaxID=1034889 RepID=UPI00081FB51B|nr:methionine adenosyltransferase [Variovorax sp. HW608]SCK28397.1 S-adenosylmethionine synthetase [Variovorax sp. HW608]
MPSPEDAALSVTTAPMQWSTRTEMCEHKGIGHPDSLCDGAVEAAARAACRAYLETYGAIQHFNLDKALLIGGISQARFGGGELVRPMRLIISGPVTELPSVPIQTVVEQAVRGYLVETLGNIGNAIGIEVILRPSAPNLRRVTSPSPLPLPLANDTSFGVGYAPLSPLENAVLRAAKTLRSSEFRKSFEAAGLDYKIMGSRLDARLRLTIALAFVDRYVQGVEDYFTLKRRIVDYLAEHLPGCEIEVNTLDDPTAHHENEIYLTVTGLSAEHGDDGEVGRGNRTNGLITPYRPMSLEAAAGKNPAAHVGKLYNVLAHRLAGRIHADVDGIDAVTVRLLSAIGRRIDQPQLAAIDVVAEGGLSLTRQHQIVEMTKQQLTAIPDLVNELVSGTLSVF